MEAIAKQMMVGLVEKVGLNEAQAAQAVEFVFAFLKEKGFALPDLPGGADGILGALQGGGGAEGLMGSLGGLLGGNKAE